MGKAKLRIKRRERHIVAMGGGGFSMEPENPLLDDFILRLTGKRRPRVCFVGTASGDADGYAERFHAAFGNDRALASHLGLFRRTQVDLRAYLMGQDVIYVGGGNTANMLAVWRVHGMDAILRRAWAAGVVMCGVSAGALCWFGGGVTDSYGPLAALDDGLGLLPGSMCPHYDGEAQRRPTYQALVRRGQLAAGYAADDGAGLHFVGRRLAEVVTSRREAAGYRVERVGRRAVETRLEGRYLGM
ncbi:MAG: peptidase [Phycisphaerales bacterium]|nr:peptidase [Phycisphaerales bacterium]